jgi:hypothetical protein
MRKQFEQGFLGSGAGAVPQLRQLLPVFEQLGAVFAHESAIYVRPGSPIPEITVVATPDTPAKGEAAIDKLIVKLAAMAGAPLRPKPITIGGTQAKELNLGRISIFYGAQGDKLVITNQQQAFQDLEGSGPKLASDATFKEAQKASSMPAETNGFLYLNLKDAIPLIESLAQLGGEQIPPDVSANLKPLRTFVAWAKNDGGTGSAALFLEIQ